jgi:hypothetical protein
MSKKNLYNYIIEEFDEYLPRNAENRTKELEPNDCQRPVYKKKEAMFRTWLLLKILDF